MSGQRPDVGHFFERSTDRLWEQDRVEQTQILAEVGDIIRDVLDPLDEKHLQVNAETTADQIDGWDSFNHISIVVAIEQHFGIKFKTAEVESLQKVGELVSLIDRKTQ
jgi:acyl carrier protein